jgi:DNA-binding transcriptional LysR family regulator
MLSYPWTSFDPEPPQPAMEIDQIETFLAIVTYGGFHKAAEALHVSQPAISGRVRALEASLGAELFTRGRARPELSPAGKAFRPHAEELLRNVAVARQAIHELQPQTAGALRVAASLSVCTYLMPDVMEKYRAANSRVMVHLRSGNSMQVLKMVLEGEADIGVARSLNHPEVETMTLREDPLMLVGHPALRSDRKRQVRLDEVESWPLIFYDRGSSDWTLSQGLFRRAGLIPNVVLEVETIEAAKRMVERKLGFSFLPQIALTDELRKGKLVSIEISDAEPLRRNLDVVHARRRPLTKEALDLFAILRSATDRALSATPRSARRRNASSQ